MALKTWQGRALAVPQITTLTVGGTVGTGDTVSVTMNRKTATATALAGDTAAALAGRLYQAIQALISANVGPEFGEVTWVDPTIAGTAYFTGTSTISGTPFTLTTGATGTTTLSQAATQAATGPNFADNTNNYDTGTLPTTGDDFTKPANTPDILYGLTALAAVDLGIVKLMGGNIGLPDRHGINPADPNSYFEYRTLHFQIKSASAVYIGDGTIAPTFCRLKIMGTTATPIRVMTGSTSNASDAIQISAAAGTSHSLTINGGSVAIAPSSGETIDIASLRIGTEGPTGSIGASDVDPVVSIGLGVTTITAVRQYGGTVTSNGSFTALTIIDGVWKQDQGTPGTVSMTDSAGTYICTGTTSHGAITARGSGVVVDFTGDSRPITVAASTFYDGAALYNPQRINCAGGFTFDKASVAASQIGNSISVVMTAA